MFSKNRLEALSDGIFAIVMTLLVLDLKIPAHVPHGELWHALREESHAWVSFAITFAISARFWTLQHNLFAVLERADARSLVTTFLFLGLVSILPFTTSLWGHYLGEPLAFFLYFLNQLLIAIALIAKLEFARRSKHLQQGFQTEKLRFKLWIMGAVMLAAALGAYFLPTQFLGFPPMFAGVAGRIGQKLHFKKLAQGEAPKSV